MIIERKKDIEKIKIHHNKKVFFIIVLLFILLITVIFFLVKNRDSGTNVENNKTCVIDSDCVPDSCCHANGCLNKNFITDCSMQLCTEVCSGPLDCGAGYCGCLNNKCEIIKK